MKKSLLLFTIVVCAFTSHAQKLVTFTLIKGVCDSDGILVANFAVTPPFHALWVGGSGRYSYYKDLTSPTDTLYHYNGGWVETSVYVGPGGTGTSKYLGKNTYSGAPPFFFKFSSSPAILPGDGTAAVTVKGGVPPYSYYWFSGYYLANYKGSGNPISLPPGEYGVAVTDAAGCWFSSLISNIGGMGSWDTIKGYSATEYVHEGLGISGHFTLFPNPATDVIHISGVNAATIILCNSVGEIVAKAEGTDRLSVASLPAGVYLAMLYDKQGALLKQEKVMKQ